MKRSILIAVLAVAAVESEYASAIPLSDNFELITTAGLYSEYSMRGVSFTQRKPAAQGTFTLAHSSGLYGGVFVSNMDIEGLDTRMENDVFGGYLLKINDDVVLDLGVIRYTYPKGSILNATETYGVLSAYGFKLGTYWSGDYYGDQAFSYNYLGYGTKALPYDIGLDLRFGVVDYKDPVFFDSDGSSRNSYQEWEVKFSKNWVGLDWAASYIDTNLSKAECLSNIGDKDSCSARLLLGVSKTF